SPNRSGTRSKYITFIKYKNEKVIITDVWDGVDLKDKNFILIDGIEMLNVERSWVSIENGKYNIIQNCQFVGAGGWGGINLVDGADYNKIINNTLFENCGPSDIIYIRGGGYNLIEGNN